MVASHSDADWTLYQARIPGILDAVSHHRGFFKAGLPREAISVYPGGHDVGGAVMTDCQRAMIFGGQTTVDQHAGNPRISVHGPGFSKIILGDDLVDRWEDYLDLMVDSVFANSGRSCINASEIYSRHTKEIADAVAQRLGPIAPLPPNAPNRLWRRSRHLEWPKR